MYPHSFVYCTQEQVNGKNNYVYMVAKENVLYKRHKTTTKPNYNNKEMCSEKVSWQERKKYENNDDKLNDFLRLKIYYQNDNDFFYSIRARAYISHNIFIVLKRTYPHFLRFYFSLLFFVFLILFRFIAFNVNKIRLIPIFV